MPRIDLAPYKEDPSLRPLDWEFGKMLARRGAVPPEDADAVILLGAKCLQSVDNGHSCLDLKDWPIASAGNSGPAADDDRSRPDSKDDPDTDAETAEHAADRSPLSCEEWVELLGRIGGIASEEKEGFTPLYFDRKHSLLYLRKYYLAEQRIAGAVLRRLEEKTDIAFDDELIKQIHGISRLYTSAFDKDRQQQAVAMALTNHFSILTGGPGTGKTTTLAAFLAFEAKNEPELRIALAAPTGKASVQIKDSLANELQNNLNISEEIKQRIRKLPASTLHRLLEIGADGAKPRFNRDNVLPYDLIVVDEVSMVSLKLLDMLFAALSPECRILLIGDQYQLASVEAGSVLGDFCSKCSLAADDSPPDQRHITHLSENHRANIDALKNFLYKTNEDAVRAGSLAEKLKEGIDGLYDGEDPNFAARELKLSGKFRQKQEELRKELEAQMDSMLAKVELPKEFVSYFYFGKEDTVKGRRLSLDEWRKLQPNGREMSDKAAQLPLALAHLYSNCFRVICAIHDGLFGERSINRMIGELLGKKNEANGTPVLILRNDPETGLSNGDTGIFWNGKVYFPEWTDNDENPGNPVFICKRSFFPDQLPDRTLAYAMTIHKSQGSGYDNVLMILPDKDSRIITRELIYTGISRTRERFMLWGKRTILETGIDRPTVRWSGLPYQFE